MKTRLMTGGATRGIIGTMNSIITEEGVATLMKVCLDLLTSKVTSLCIFQNVTANSAEGNGLYSRQLNPLEIESAACAP